MPNPTGRTGPTRQHLIKNSHALGQWGEGQAAKDLRSKGFRVFLAASLHGHPDLYAQGPDGEPIAIEVRVEQVCEVLDRGSPDYGRRWYQRRKYPGDRADHYAWVHPATGHVAYEPPLPQYEIRRAA